MPDCCQRSDEGQGVFRFGWSVMAQSRDNHLYAQKVRGNANISRRRCSLIQMRGFWSVARAGEWWASLVRSWRLGSAIRGNR